MRKIFLFLLVLFFISSEEASEDRIAELIRELTTPAVYVQEKECLWVKATAYSNDEVSVNILKWRDGLTATMMKAARGTVAVDPRIIPWGSVLWIEDYGYGIALDRGSAIKGYRIDLFFDTREEALEWGVRDVLVCIIGHIDVVVARKKIIMLQAQGLKWR